jgi:hypothetical protein
MGNLERPLTWGLGLLFILGLFIVNCECGDDTTCPLNNAFNITNSGVNADALEVDVPETVTEVTVEVIVEDGDTTVAIETSDNGTDVGVETETEGE